jgi:uncharacterized membrane protein
MTYRPYGMGLAAPVALIWMAVGCSMSATPPEPHAQTWQCGDLRVETRFMDDSVELNVTAQTFTLHQRPAASGARYADEGGNEFWNKGGWAMLTLSSTRTLECRETALRSPWVEARERGVRYRAMGQEPGWVAEVDAGDAPSLRVLLGYGERVLEVMRSQPLGDTEGYTGHVQGIRVSLHILPGPCRDSMSGELFGTRAEVRVGDSVYAGCGDYL